jgi:hypothetical protein
MKPFVLLVGMLGAVLLAEQPPQIPVPPVETSLPAMPGVDALASVEPLPEVLRAGDGRMVSSAAGWRARREEMKQVLSYYAVGRMPPPPGNVAGTVLKSASLAGGTVSYQLVHLAFGPGRALGFDVALFVPADKKGPFPVVIFPSFGLTPGATPLPTMLRLPEQGKGLDALTLPLGDPAPRIATTTGPPSAGPQPPPVVMDPPADPDQAAKAHAGLFRRGYALATYHYQDAGEDTIRRNDDGSWAFRNTRFFPAYPGYDWGLLGVWAWSVSRVADFLEGQPYAIRTALVAIGHSRIGKAVLVAGAFDERLAVTAPAGSGAGGTGAYRFNGAGYQREGLDDMMRKYPNWFSPHLHQFAGRVLRLPFDQHWFMALTAPRAFVSLEGTEDQNCLLSALKAARDGAMPAYALLRAAEAIGVHYAPHRHALTQDDWDALIDFADARVRGLKTARRFDQFPVAATALGRSAAGRSSGCR